MNRYKDVIDLETFQILKDIDFDFRLLNYLPVSLIPDAIQTAILANLEGKSPNSAVRYFEKKERRHSRTFKTNAYSPTDIQDSGPNQE
ncbi:MAG: hypothetical protein BIFFINMI_02387 [Phycisphaerae bacterium]|nr:hypothetical protein [Phycisphaerae bacterium]